MTTFRRIALPAVAAMALISGCSAESGTDATPSPAASSSAAAIPTVTASQETQEPPATEAAEEPTATEEPAVVADAGPNETDKTFAATLITHNLQAYDLTGLAATAAGDQWVRDFAAEIRAAREPEVATLKSWLSEWAVEPLERGKPMPGLISDKEMADLAGSAGAAFDERFVALMIKHQKGALALAEEEAAGGEYGPGIQMANAITESGQKHLKELQRYQKSLK
ncbi:DUF305 domain-containing protein [Herbidospora sp. NEAU-GS84]|uniref:DUF305 domain-containing protein n=1 Tax=Herbidospora solisilvae TaxID=2696284 RepID=A0A7C9J478_9ACTN|nr:DUF305 domain-containing protein [Herbidospora solisilvae]NAS24226.1 DUF305 domain-containing protein [Herbidospora solisilvae]